MTPIRVRIAAREMFGQKQKAAEGYVVAFEMGAAIVVYDDGSFHHVSLAHLTEVTMTERDEAQRVIEEARARRVSSGA